MPTAIVTGSGGLIGSESVRSLVEQGYDVIGLENDMRAYFFGKEASTAATTTQLRQAHPEFRSLEVDVRDAGAVDAVVRRNRDGLELIVHAAGQPSHDWAAKEPQTDFGVNANGTLNPVSYTHLTLPTTPYV